MAKFALILLLFLVIHSIPARPALRSRLVSLLGAKLYLSLYGALSVILLAWLIIAAREAPYVPLWSPTLAQYWAPILIMPLALFLLIGGLLSPNPLSVGFRGSSFDPDRPGVLGITRHPILWGFGLWAISHVVPNGDLVSVVMFGGFSLFALAAMPMIDRRKRREFGSRWDAATRAAPAIPLMAPWKSRRWAWPAGLLSLTMCMTILAYAGLLMAHPWLFGPDPTLAFRGG